MDSTRYKGQSFRIGAASFAAERLGLGLGLVEFDTAFEFDRFPGRPHRLNSTEPGLMLHNILSTICILIRVKIIKPNV